MGIEFQKFPLLFTPSVSLLSSLLSLFLGGGVQLLGHVRFFVTPWTAAPAETSLSFTLSQSSLKLMSIHCVSDPVQPSHPLSPISLPALSVSLLASGSFPVSRPFASSGQTIGTSLGVYFLKVASLFTHGYRSRSSFFKNLPLEKYKK